jgi:hypothetical protein
MIDGVSHGLIFEYLFYLIDVRVIFIVDLDPASVGKLSITADCRVRIFIGDYVLRIANILELIKDHWRGLISDYH